jgi:hypothetical protein
VIPEEIVWRADDEEQWGHARMQLLSNDRWRAVLELPRLGRRRFAAESWLDPYASFARDLADTRDAGQDVTLETREGAALICAATFRTNGQIGAALEHSWMRSSISRLRIASGCYSRPRRWKGCIAPTNENRLCAAANT